MKIKKGKTGSLFLAGLIKGNWQFIFCGVKNVELLVISTHTQPKRQTKVKQSQAQKRTDTIKQAKSRINNDA